MTETIVITTEWSITLSHTQHYWLSDTSGFGHTYRDVTWVFCQLVRLASSSQMCMEKGEAPWIRGEITKSSLVWLCLPGVYYDRDKWEHSQIQLAEIRWRSLRRWPTWHTERMWIRFTHIANMNLSSRSSCAVLQKIPTLNKVCGLFWVFEKTWPLSFSKCMF